MNIKSYRPKTTYEYCDIMMEIIPSLNIDKCTISLNLAHLYTDSMMDPVNFKFDNELFNAFCAMIPEESGCVVHKYADRLLIINESCMVFVPYITFYNSDRV